MPNFTRPVGTPVIWTLAAISNCRLANGHSTHVGKICFAFPKSPFVPAALLNRLPCAQGRVGWIPCAQSGLGWDCVGPRALCNCMGYFLSCSQVLQSNELHWLVGTLARWNCLCHCCLVQLLERHMRRWLLHPAFKCFWFSRWRGNNTVWKKPEGAVRVHCVSPAATHAY